MTTVYQVLQTYCHCPATNDLFATPELAEQYIMTRYGRAADASYEVVPRTIHATCPTFRFDLRVYVDGSVLVCSVAPDDDLKSWHAIWFEDEPTPLEIRATCDASGYDDAYQLAIEMRDALRQGDTDVPVYQAGKRIGTVRYGQRVQSVFEVTLDESGD